MHTEQCTWHETRGVITYINPGIHFRNSMKTHVNPRKSNEKIFLSGTRNERTALTILFYRMKNTYSKKKYTYNTVIG